MHFGGVNDADSITAVRRRHRHLGARRRSTARRARHRGRGPGGVRRELRLGLRQQTGGSPRSARASPRRSRPRRGGTDHDAPLPSASRASRSHSGTSGAEGRRPRRRARQHLRPARLQRRRQDHARAHPRHPAHGRRRQCPVHGFDVAAAAGRGARVDQPHGPVRGGRRHPDRAREPRARGAAAPRRRMPGRSPTRCSRGSSSPTPPTAGSATYSGACAAGSTSR